jgi:hypothetical protein
MRTENGVEQIRFSAAFSFPLKKLHLHRSTTLDPQAFENLRKTSPLRRLVQSRAKLGLLLRRTLVLFGPQIILSFTFIRVIDKARNEVWNKDRILRSSNGRKPSGDAKIDFFF